MSRPSAALLLSMLLLPTAAAAQPGPGSLDSEAALALLEKVRLYSEGERPSDPPARLEELGPRRTSPGRRIQHRGFTSVQVNVDGAGLNIMDDAANEPSIAVDPTDSSRMAIGWRQFDSITSSFREAGWGFSSDGGATWTAGEIDSGVFRSDPVLDADASGGFYYNSLTTPSGSLRCEVFRSDDGGASWGAAIDAFGGDKQWMAIDRTGGLGSGHIYTNWNQAFSCCGPTGFTRSTDGGDSYEAPIDLPQLPAFATVAVAPGGEVFVAGARGLDEVVVLRSTTLR
ncbi:MAG: sialidase family protein, partial [Acidobacteriota bacterium]